MQGAERESVTEVSPERIKAARELIEVAMRRVREGRVDENDVQSVMLRNDQGISTRYFYITDHSVDAKKRWLGLARSEVTSKGKPETGLFIKVIGESDAVLFKIFTFVLPRSSSLLTEEIWNRTLWAHSSEYLEQLTQTLGVAQKVSSKEFKHVREALWQRERDEENERARQLQQRS